MAKTERELKESLADAEEAFGRAWSKCKRAFGQVVKTLARLKRARKALQALQDERKASRAQKDSQKLRESASEQFRGSALGEAFKAAAREDMDNGQ